MNPDSIFFKPIQKYPLYLSVPVTSQELSRRGSKLAVPLYTSFTEKNEKAGAPLNMEPRLYPLFHEILNGFGLPCAYSVTVP